MIPDTCIDMTYYKSYCVKKNDTLVPSYCAYKLWKPTKKSSRIGHQFHGNAKHFDYAKSGYDKGHLVPAEDMAFSSQSMDASFVWWNCVPQKPKLNRGAWRVEEMRWHNYADKDSILIIVGATSFKDGVPSYCYKIVKSLSSKKVLSTSIYAQDGSKVVVPKNFLDNVRNLLK